MYLGLTLCLAVSDCFCLCLDNCSRNWINSLCLALLDTVRRSKTHACPSNTLCLASSMSVCCVLTNACFMTTPFNKALQMDLFASLLVGFLTEYSTTKGSSSFSNGHWPGMDTAKLLFALKQDNRSLESYI